MLRPIAILSLTLLFHGPALAQQPTKAERDAMALSGEQASHRMSLRGVLDLDPALWVSSEPFLKGNADDKFFRARIDKETGQVTYQVYLRSTSRRPPRLSKMTYLIDGKLKSADIDIVGSDVSCHRYGCTHFEDGVAEIPRADLDALAAGEGPTWQTKLFGKSIEGITTQFLRNETAGFLMSVDRALARSDVYRAAR